MGMSPFVQIVMFTPRLGNAQSLDCQRAWAKHHFHGARRLWQTAGGARPQPINNAD
jgi:hypothetical protein